MEDINTKSIKFLIIDRIIVNRSAIINKSHDSIELALFEGAKVSHQNISSNKLFSFNTKLD